MNLFKILSTGDGSIKEPSVSAFLAYLIDNQEHEFAVSLLERLILPCLYESNLAPYLCVGTEDRPSLNPDYTHSIDLEYSVYPDERIDRRTGRSDIDILITFTNSQNENDRFYVAVEVKTSDKSFRQGQLRRQFDGLINQGIGNDKLFCLLIAPSESTSAISELESLPTENKSLLLWKSIATVLSHFVAETDIQDAYFRQTLLAFCEFIKTNFKSYQEEVQNRTRRDYNERGVNLECFLAIYEQLGAEEQISRRELKERYVRELANRGLTPSATSTQVSIYIVNEPSRCNNHARPDRADHSLFYYTQQQGVKGNWLLKKVVAGTFPDDVIVYWRGDGQRRADYLINYPCHLLH